MRHTLFISDLHLCESRPQTTAAFLAWLAERVPQADALYILGDFFEFWAGDDAVNASFHQSIIHALKHTTASGTPIYLMHGNRDFLIGSAFAEQTGIQLLADPTLLKLYQQPLLLTHGDALCTDDVRYMAFRNTVREPAWQQAFLSQPLAERLAYIQQARAASSTEKASKQAKIMDVNGEALASLLRVYDYPPLLIHGHTHRPQQHVHQVDGHVCARWVLGDWYDQGSCLSLNEHGILAVELLERGHHEIHPSLY